MVRRRRASGSYTFQGWPHGEPRPPRKPMAPMSPIQFSDGFKFTSGNSCCGMMSFGGGRSSTIQTEEDGELLVVTTIPGIDKTTLKVRAKTKTLSIKASIKESLHDYLGDDDVEMIISLTNDVDKTTAKASYSDGILQVRLKLADVGEEAEID